MQVTRPVSIEALTDALADFMNHLKKVGVAETMELAASLDLSFSQLCGLFIMDISDHPLALHELAERLGLSVAATGRAVEALVRAGLVDRREDAHDRRVKRISMSEAGEALILRLTEAQREGLRAFAGLLNDEERQNLFTALAPILARLELHTHQQKENE